MLVSLKEIAKYVDISGLTPEEIASRLTFSGIEVEEIKTLSQATNLVVGKVISCLPHPNSDHLHVCKVDVGTEISSLIEKFGLLKTAVVGIGTYAGIKNVGVA